MLERLVLHIGTQKTGSTAIQSSLTEASEALRRQGVLYPRAGRLGLGHDAIPTELAYTDTPVDEVSSRFGLLEEVRAACPATVLISAENLFSTTTTRTLEWAVRLREELEPRTVDVVAYVRPQWEGIEAGYAKRVAGGQLWEAVDEYVERALATREHDYLEQFAPWREAFGERFALRPFRTDLLLQDDVVADFWDFADLGHPPPADGRSNPRAGARAVEMLRLMRAFLADHGIDEILAPADAPELPRRRALMATFGRARRRLEAALPEDRPFSPLSPEDLARMAAELAPSNEQFVEIYFGGRHRDLFSPPAEPRQPSAWSLNEASEAELRVFAQVLEEMLGEVAPPGAADLGRRQVRATGGARATVCRAAVGALRRSTRSLRRRRHRATVRVRRVARRLRRRLRRLRRRARRALGRRVAALGPTRSRD